MLLSDISSQANPMSLSDKSDSAEFDPYSYHEQNAGRLIINPECVLKHSDCFKLISMHSRLNTERHGEN